MHMDVKISGITQLRFGIKLMSKSPTIQKLHKIVKLNVYIVSYLPLRHAVCFDCHGEISRTVCPPVACLVPSESPQRGGVHGLCFVDGKLLNFKVFL